MADDDDLRLLALACSRLCHDLVGPAGAIANGLELTADPALATAALELTRTTSGQLNRRLAFYRRAWGTGHGLTWAEAHKVATGLLQDGRHSLDWGGSPGEGGAAEARLALNMLLCLMDATPLGARLSVSTGALPRVAAEGEVRRAEALAGALAEPPASLEAVTPRDAQPFLTVRLARAAGFGLVMERSDDERIALALRR